RIEQTRLRTGNAHRVAKSRKDYAGLLCDRDGIVHPAERNDADRAARPMNHFDVARQQVLDAILENRVRMATANFHQLQGTARQSLNLFSEFERQIALPVLVN